MIHDTCCISLNGYALSKHTRSVMFFVTSKCKCPAARHEFKSLLCTQLSMCTCKAELVVRAMAEYTCIS